jgi:hypothetical protein
MLTTLAPAILTGGGGDKKGAKTSKAVYTTQQEVDAANLFAKEFLKRRHFDNVTNPEDAYVAQKVGDPVVPITGGAKGVKKAAMVLPNYVKPEDIKGDSETGYYYENNDGDIVDIDPSVLNLPKFRRPQMLAGMMNGLTNNL